MKQIHILWITISLSFILLIPVKQSKAQNILLGAKAGINQSTIALNYTDIYDFRMGENLGLFAEFQTDALPFNITAEFHYMIFGANNIEQTLIYYADSPILDLSIENSHFYFNSFEVPLMVKFNLPFIEALNPQFYVGGAYNYIYTAYTQNEYENEEVSDAEITPRIKANDYSGLAGIGGFIDIGDFAITYDVRYRMGFSNLNNVVGYNEFTAHSLQFMVGFGYRIGFGSEE